MPLPKKEKQIRQYLALTQLLEIRAAIKGYSKTISAIGCMQDRQTKQLEMCASSNINVDSALLKECTSLMREARSAESVGREQLRLLLEAEAKQIRLYQSLL